MGNHTRLCLLGPVLVEWAGQVVRGFESHKALALLGYLAAQDHPLSRPHLADLFWRDKSEARGRGNLRRVLHNLSTLLPGCLTIERDTIQFCRRADSWVDLRAFEELRAQDTLSSLAAAAELYRDEFMAGLFLDGAPDFEMWLVTERERWRQRVAQVLYTLIVRHTERGEHAAGLQFASRLLALDPWREEAHRAMMRLRALTGQRSEAMAQYETCRRILAQEFGIEPSVETTTLFEQIRDGTLAPAPLPPRTSPHNLPIQLTPFVGREQELAKITDCLRKPDCRLLTRVGPGGIGKTRLALQAASARVGEFAHGVFYVPLSPISAPDLLVSAIANAIKLTFSSGQDSKAQLLDYLREKELLLLLDGFEHLLGTQVTSPKSHVTNHIQPATGDMRPDACDLLIEILKSAARVKAIVTSRERLNLQAEWLFDIEGLPYPTSPPTPQPPSPSPELSAGEGEGGKGIGVRYAAIALFKQTAQRAQANFAFEPEQSSIVRICQLVEGMPLAIELAAASVRQLPCGTLATQIERSLDALTTTMRDLPARHRSIRAAFDHSWNLLTEEERRAFHGLSVFRGGFDEEAAQVLNSEFKIQNSKSSPGSPDRITNYELRICSPLW